MKSTLEPKRAFQQMNSKLDKVMRFNPFRATQAICHTEIAKQAAAEEKIQKKKATRRNQSKINQRRYRSEQRQTIESLETDVYTLNTEVARLEGGLESLRVTLAPYSLQTGDPEKNLLKEYYRIFMNGYNPSIAAIHMYQSNFLKMIMEEDVHVMGERSLSKVFDQWCLYTALFSSFQIECCGFDVVIKSHDVVIESRIILHLRISRASLKYLFPHILSTEDIAQKLIGKVMMMPVTSNFYFGKHMKVYRMDTQADSVIGLVNLLGCLSETMLVLEGSKIRASCELDIHPNLAEEISREVK
jgi:hypothetical protein